MCLHLIMQSGSTQNEGIRIPLRQGYLRRFLYGTDGVTGTVSLSRHGIHGNGVEHVEAAHGLGTVGTGQRLSLIHIFFNSSTMRKNYAIGY